MTISRGLWVPINTGNVGTTEVEARLAMAGLFETINGTDPRSGLLRPPASGVVVTGTVNTAPMTYTIGPCQPVINRVANEGAYHFAAVGNTTVNTTAAPGANSRIDVIWVKQNDQSKGDADNLAVAGVTQGVVSATPVAPAIPTGALAIAQAVILNTTTATNTAVITQVYPYAALRGVPIPVRNVTDRATIVTPVVGQQVERLDLPGQPVEEYTTAYGWTDVSPSRGILLRKKIITDGIGLSTLSVVENFATFTFRGGRKYRIVWATGFEISAASNYFNIAIHTASTADAAGAITGLTTIMTRSLTANNAGSGEFFYLEAPYEPAADETKQIKFTVARALGAGTFTPKASAPSPAWFYIEDLGANY
jgi:hypothetical protein